MADKPPCLTVLGGAMAGTRFVLEDGVPSVMIGSDPSCGFHLPLPGVSPLHVRIVVEPGGVTLQDAGGDRGVHINDTKVAGSAPLRNGDIVWLGTPGEGDVVMLQCILPRLPFMGAPAAAAAEEEEDIGGRTIAAAPFVLTPAAPEPHAPVEAPVSLDPGALFSAPPVEIAAVEETFVVEPTVMAHSVADPSSPVFEPEEAGVVVPADETLLRQPTPADAPMETTLLPTTQHDFVLAEEMVAAPVSTPPVVIPPPPPPLAAPVLAMPPGFEDETGERIVVDEDPPAETVIVAHDVVLSEPPVSLPLTDFDAPLTPAPTVALPPAAPAPRPTPPAPAPIPPEAPAKPAPAAARPTPPARPAAPTPARRPPSASQATPAAPKAEPAAPAPAPRPAAKSGGSSSSTGLYAGIGLGALLVLGLGGYFAMKALGKKEAPAPTPPPIAQATPTPGHVTAPPPPTAAPVTAPTPEPTPAESVVTTIPPAPVTPPPTPATGPSAKPTPTPSPSKGAPTPAPTAAASTAPAGPSPEQLRAQQAAALVAQAETALAAHSYDQAVGLLDEALRADAGNARATSLRAQAVAQRDLGKRRFVAGRTVVTTEKGGGGNISGFEGAAVVKAPDFTGRIEFEMSPSSGLKPGDPWTLKLYVVNDGKKAIRITDLAATATVNGAPGGGAASARGREVAPQQRVQVGEMAGAWKDGTTSWSADVTVTAKGDSLKNTLTWK